MVSQENPPSGSRNGRRRSWLSSSWTSHPSLRISLSAEASAAAATASISSCSRGKTKETFKSNQSVSPRRAVVCLAYLIGYLHSLTQLFYTGTNMGIICS